MGHSGKPPRSDEEFAKERVAIDQARKTVGGLEKDPRNWDGIFLKDARQETLAQLLAEPNTELQPWPDMAEKAGYSLGKTLSSTRSSRQYFRKVIMKRPDIQIRVLELMGEAQPLTEGVDIRDEVLESLRGTRIQAKKDRDWTAVNRANELIGKSTGMFTDVIRHSDPFEEMGPDELERTVAGLLKDPIIRGMVQRALSRYEDDAKTATKH